MTLGSTIISSSSAPAAKLVLPHGYSRADFRTSPLLLSRDRAVRHCSRRSPHLLRRPKAAMGTVSTSRTAVADADCVTDTARKAAAQAALDLEERGWTCIEGVLSPEECNEYVDSVWEWLESLGTGIKRNDPATWSDEQWPPTFKGIINVLEVAHQEFVWRVRSHPKVVQIFQHLWGTTELLSSFDSINVLRPGSHVVSTDDWLHCDQAPHRKGLACIQGLVNMVDVGPDTGTLLVKDGSHAGHEQFFATETVLTPEEKLTTADFYQFHPQERKFYEQYKALPLSASAGSLFLWDSRTAHQNIMPANTEKWRHVVYCCYQPRDIATVKDLKLKKQAWDDHRITTHWPSQNVAVFPKLGPGYYSIATDDTAAQEAYMQRLEKFKICKLYLLVCPVDVPGVTVKRSRQNVPSLVSKLAGVQPYSADEIQQDKPLAGMSREELLSIVKS